MKYLILICLSAMICSCLNSSVFEDKKRAIVGAPNIVYGKVIDKIDLFETYSPYRTRYLFRIEETIKGNTYSDTISLLGYSGKTSKGSRVERSYDYQFDEGDERILIIYPLKRTMDSLDIRMKELCQGKSKVNYDIPNQYRVGEVISFLNGTTVYSKSGITYKKMISLIKNYLDDPSKLIPASRVRI